MGTNSNFAINKQIVFRYLALVLSSICLLIPAFWNHGPLVNPDTATYIESGFIPEMPSDRPITYGLLVRLFTLNGLSLWLIVFAQAYVVSWLIFRVIKNMSGNRPYILPCLFVTFLLSITTSLSWIVSQVQPDVFTSIALLCVFVLLIGKENKRTNTILYTLFFFSVAVHLSHPLLMIAVLIFLFLFCRVYSAKSAAKPTRMLITLGILSLVALLTMVTPIAKSKHIFFMGSLLEKGVLKKYLDENCGAKNYKLCAYKDALPKKADDFWWDPESPLNKMGDWKSVKPEFNDIIHDIFTKPTYIKLYAVATVEQAAKQLVTINIGDGNQSFPPGSYVSRTIAKCFPNDARQFAKATQNNSVVLDTVAVPNKIFAGVIILSLLGLVYMLLRWKILSKEMKLLVLVCISGILLNSLDCAAFGTINGRYGCKMFWLIPFCIMAFVLNYNVQERKDSELEAASSLHIWMCNCKKITIRLRAHQRYAWSVSGSYFR